MGPSSNSETYISPLPLKRFDVKKYDNEKMLCGPASQREGTSAL